MSERRIVIAGTGSGVGKTTVTIGLMAALRRRGLQVQGFKCGPDYIDPTYHTAVTGRPSRNLDSWMLPHPVVREIFVRGSAGADISLIEGVMGFYDGLEATSDVGSTAEISILTESPVLLVVDCHSMARSAAAIVKGFQLLNPKVRIAAVFANQVGSQGHYQLIKEAVEKECGVPLIGYLVREEQLEIPERHLGLVPSIERGDVQPLFDRLAEQIGRTVDLDRLLAVARAAPLAVESCLFPAEPAAKRVKIAVAQDAAFHFYYAENLELLESYGAECVFFSPLAGEPVPAGVHGLYLGGGFPEAFAAQLSGDRAVIESVRAAIQAGLPTLAECGGFMYLCEELETTDGQRFPLVGVIPGRITMQRRLAALGYREVTGIAPNFLLKAGESAKGHEFHYSTYVSSGDVPYAYETKGLQGGKREGYARGNLVASYIHLHFASNPALVKRWIERCREVAQDG